jgi:hypothetical protein
MKINNALKEELSFPLHPISMLNSLFLIKWIRPPLEVLLRVCWFWVILPE